MPYPVPEFSPSAPVNPDDPGIWDWGFQRVITLCERPAVGAGILSTGTFFLIVFVSRAVLAQVSLHTMGYALTFSILAFLALVILILFMI